MRRALPNLLPWLLFLGASTAAFVALRVRPAWDVALARKAPTGHFEVVSAVALICVLIGVAAGVAAMRSANPRVLWLALSFLSAAAFFAVHGLTTPGFLVEREYANVTGFSVRVGFLAASALLAASAVEWPAPFSAAVIRHRVAIFVAACLALAAFAAMALLDSPHVPRWFVAHASLAYATTFTTCALGLFATARYFTGYRRTQLPLFGAVAFGAVLLVQAQISAHFGGTWRGTFWLYHVQLLIGFGAILRGIVIEYGRGRALRSIEQLSVSDVMQQLRAGYTESILSLAAALEARDGYTLGHGERVAALSIFMGQQLRLSTPRLRALAAGALLHDVGKIGIPDAVLHKRGPLTTAEYDVIKEHPGRGDAMLSAAFSGAAECAVIRHHHERWDGGGYPDALGGEAIPLEARIVAVADVYDALRSNRAYRPAWDGAVAVALIAEGSGSQFDPRCVEAFGAVVGQWEAQYAAAHLAYDERRSAQRVRPQSAPARLGARGERAGAGPRAGRRPPVRARGDARHATAGAALRPWLGVLRTDIGDTVGRCG